ncbi:MAG: molybdopterin-synthase adenylyltransferase MoeB [Sedimentisphaerales bacterium]|nr:molybdopterin-synthase adenylyltransferase MoeB [Sedimentisphaerales bacterium]
MSLSEQQIERYSRNILLQEIGGNGQEKLLASRVLIIGVGGLGSPAALYLAAAGVGTLGLMDGDEVDVTNLQRQIVHHTADIGKRKVDSARDKIRAINPDVTVQTHDLRARADNIRQIIREYNFVLDATDNFATKFLINDACCFERVPFCHAGILQFEGQLITVIPGRTACYRCVFHSPPPPGSVPSCGQAGVLGVLPGVIGSLQATEAIKYLLGIGTLATDCLLTYSALTMEFRKVHVGRNADCPLCGPNPTITTLACSPAALGWDSQEPPPRAGVPHQASTHTLDLRGVPCPLNLVKAKLALENIRVGEVLEIRLDAGEPAANLPASLARQGQEILGTAGCDSHFCVTVRRTL